MVALSGNAQAAKAWLQETNENGVSVYGHVTQVLAKLLEDRPADALAAVESLSQQVKDAHFTPASAVAPPAPTAAPEAESSVAWQQSTSDLLKARAARAPAAPPAPSPPSPPPASPALSARASAQAPPADAEPEDTGDMHIPNLMEEMRAFEWAGFGLSESETYRLFVSMCKLQTSKGLKTVRLFGKILGTGADYYVVEATYAEPPEAPEGDAPAADAVAAEENGKGCNACVYFVANDAASAWTELPAVTPAQIVASRAVRKYFTGNLDADVRAFPPFPGSEKEYLRAQIARIVHATTLCPAGKFALDEEEEVKETVNEVPEEEYVRKTPAEMLSPANWCHRYAGILAIGRCTNPPKPEEDEGEEGAAKAADEPEAETPPLVSAADEDWSLRLCASMGAGTSISVARSLKWPGAVNVATMKEDSFASLYVGYGHETLGAPFAPVAPPPLQGLPADLAEDDDTPLGTENAAVLKVKKEELEAAIVEEGGEE